jgi:hypothetical protein
MKRVRLVVTAVLILAGWAQPQVPTCSGSGVAGTGLAVTGGTTAASTADDPRDILYAGRRDFANLMLDPGRDDYYATGNSCADISTSALWISR